MKLLNRVVGSGVPYAVPAGAFPERLESKLEPSARPFFLSSGPRICKERDRGRQAFGRRWRPSYPGTDLVDALPATG